MRYIILYVLFATGCYNLYSQNVNAQHFVIKGKYFGERTKVISCSYRDAFDKWVTTDCEIVNGRFALGGSIRGATDMWLTSKLSLGSRDDPNGVEVLIEPGTIEILLRENQFKSIKIKGSPIQKKYDSLEKSMLPIYTKMRPLSFSLGILNDSLDYLIKLKDFVKI